ncbi:MAG TPA: pantoate--beta-alanine ligase [Clostridiales bacterium]|nr:pantoate--beta-alanine ligase [Clostridiales bacterium]
MKIIKYISEIKNIVKKEKISGKTIGLVPTMGYLHEGHLSLIRSSVRDNEVTIVSVFVNPTQFGPNEDYNRYPRDLEKDAQHAENTGADILFAPSVEEMYPDGYRTYINVEGITEVLCGRSRPGHFKGVATVVAKLFNITEADRAYFGLKDAQQFVAVKKMVEDLNMNIEIIPCPIIREADGLAMSSRNAYLSLEEREAALVLSHSLFEAEAMVKKGERDISHLLESIKRRISLEKLASVEYIEAVNADTLENIYKIEDKTKETAKSEINEMTKSEIKEEIKSRNREKVLVALAIKIGTTRLIDNIIVEV